MVIQPLDRLWAKIRRSDPKIENSRIVSWLSLSDHSADVAAVFEALLRLRGFRRRASHLLGRPLTDNDIGRLAVLAYLHDIGKGNSGFQSKVLESARRHFTAPRGHVNEAVCLIGNHDLLRLCVDHLRFCEMEAWFEDPSDFQSMLVASWSHHGTPLAVNVIEGLSLTRDPAWQPWEWASPEVTIEMFGREISRHFDAAFVPGDIFPHSGSPRFQAFFSGLLSLADWIGSNEEWFGFDASDPEDRMAWSRRRAASVLTLMGLDSEKASAAVAGRPGDFKSVFGKDAPTAMQATVMRLELRLNGRGSVVLIESETGSGKTEAAMAHAFALYRAGEIDGVYFALPTRTSGVQICGRMETAVLAAFGEQHAPAVVLAVPGYQIPGIKSPHLLCDPSVRWDESAPGSAVRAREWFSENSKRYLAAPFAAGTVDQVLLSALRNKHAHLRAASMARSLLIIDEIHASDAYMAKVTAEVVRRHVGAGGHVLLMSATLGAEAARLYVGGPRLMLNEASQLEYPLIRFRDEGAKNPTLVPIVNDGHTLARGKAVRMVPVELAGDDRAIAELAARHAIKGARILVIRNTVAACVGTRRALGTLLPTERVFTAGENRTHAPHHGRFAAQDRVLLDKAVEREFGKNRPSGGLVLVATQTVEQSLDIDADVLITDLCPMDVLLQRIGRLHRHVRDGLEGNLAARPEGYAEATCFVICPHATLPLTKQSAHGIGKDRAYQDVRIIELTLRQIRACGTFEIPSMNRALVEATVHSEAKATLDAEDPAWAVHGQQIAGGALGDKLTAEAGLLVVDHPFGSRTQFEGWTGPKVATRLGLTPVSAIFPEGAGPISPFGRYHLGIVSIPHWMAPKTLTAGEENERKVDAIPVVTMQRENGFEFEFAGQDYAYDADGLRKKDGNEWLMIS